MLINEKYFVIRTPLLPFAVSQNLGEAQLREIANYPLVREALFVASPDLYSQLDLFLSDSLSAEETRKVRLALKKYVLRISSRSTPFGLFASVSHGLWGESTSLQIQSIIKRSTRLDMTIASKVVERIASAPEVIDNIRYFSNNTIYQVNQKIRYVECNTMDGKRTFQLSDLDTDESICSVIDNATFGKTRHELADSVVDSDIDKDIALGFIDDMIANQLLVSELDMRITGENYLHNVKSIIDEYGLSASLLSEIEDGLAILDTNFAGNDVALYQVLFEKLQSLCGQAKIQNFIQIDTFRPSSAVINKGISKTLSNVIQCLGRLFPPAKNPLWDEFKGKFAERYGSMSIPLWQVLDPEIGLGYPSSEDIPMTECTLLKNVEFSSEPDVPPSAFSTFYEFLSKEYHKSVKLGTTVELSEQALRPFMRDCVLPNSLYAMANLIANNEDNVERLTVQFRGAYGPSAINIVARFCHVDKELSTLVKETINKEKLSFEGVFAEVVHVDQFRTGNISSRPVLRDYEIPIVTLGGANADNTIPIDDLMLSESEGRLVLTSKRLGCEVIPRLSSAHNYVDGTIGVYRFLCDMQHQGISSSVQWEWGPLSNASFLPRVSLDGVIVSPAQWRFEKIELEALANDPTLLAAAVNDLRKNRGLPRYVLTGEGDNKIPIDLENIEHLEVFANIVQRSKTVEEFFGEICCPAKDELNRRYQHELVVPFLSKEKVSVTPRVVVKDNLKKQRKFGLGTEWLYYKIYCNAKAADVILTKYISGLVRDLLSSETIDQWFFLRYKDPKYHIRVRFHGVGSFYAPVISKFNKIINPLIEQDLVSEVATAVYDRELERYGFADIELVEEFFFTDSNFVIALLAEFSENDDWRWQAALVMVYDTMAIFDLEDAAMTRFVENIQQQFLAEMGFDSKLKASLSRVLRDNKLTIRSVLQGNGLPEQIIDLLKNRKQMLEPLAKSLLQSDVFTDNSLIVSRLQSFIHMTINRLFNQISGITN